MVMPPCRVLPHPPSRYLNPRPPKMCRAKPTLQGFCLSCSPLCLLATKSSVSWCQWQQCVLSLCAALLASTCPCSCRCHSSVSKLLQVCTGDTRTLQLPHIHGASAAHLEGNATLGTATCASSFTGFNPCLPLTRWQRCGWHHRSCFVDLCHMDTRVQSMSPCAIRTCNEGMRHREGESWD